MVNGALTPFKRRALAEAGPCLVYFFGSLFIDRSNGDFGEPESYFYLNLLHLSLSPFCLGRGFSIVAKPDTYFSVVFWFFFCLSGVVGSRIRGSLLSSKRGGFADAEPHFLLTFKSVSQMGFCEAGEMICFVSFSGLGVKVHLFSPV